MNLKEKIRTTSFWIGVSAVAIIVVDTISNYLGFSICSDGVSKFILGICSILILFGFVNKKNVGDIDSTQRELLDEIRDVNTYDDGKSVNSTSDEQKKN